MLPGAIQGVGSYLESSSWFGARLLTGPSLPHWIYFCPIRSSMRGMLWIPSTRETGPRKKASSARMSTLLNIISPRLNLPQTYWFFVRHLKTWNIYIFIKLIKISTVYRTYCHLNTETYIRAGKQMHTPFRYILLTKTGGKISFSL